MAIGDERHISFSSSFTEFDLICIAVIIIAGLALLAYNTGINLPAVGGNGLLNSINESNAAVYVIVFIVGALLFVRMHRVNLSERVRITNASLPAILASFFIFASIFYFVAGFNDTFISSSGAQQGMLQTYGWIVEFLLYIAIAEILLVISKNFKKAAERDFTVRTYPIGEILGVFIAIVLFIGFAISETAQNGGVVMQIGNIAGVFEILIFGGLAYFFIWTEDSILRKQELTNEGFYAPASALGICCVVVSVISYVAVVMQYVEVGSDMRQFLLSIAGAAVLGVVGVSLTIVASLLFRTNSEEHVVSPMLFLIGATYAILAIIQLFIGLDEFLRSPEQNMRWILGILLFLLPSLVSYVIAPIVKTKSEEYYGKARVKK